MKSLIPYAVAAVALLGLVASAIGPEAPPPVKPAPVKPAPAPCPPDKPCPPNKPWGPRQSAGRQNPLSVGAKVGGPSLDGSEVSCDYPGDRHVKNTASKGLGLCVFTSIHHACDWQNVPALLNMPKWMISKGIPGGGYPAKVAQLIPRLAQERGQPTPEYFQVESNDLEILKTACASGRMPCITYAFSPTGRYGGSRIAHMVNLVHADDKYFVILDNNYVGEDKYEWLTPQEFLRSYSGGSTGWAVIFNDPPPPMPPYNANATKKVLTGRDEVGGGGGCEKTCGCSPDCTCGCNQGRPCQCGGAPDPATTGVEWDKISTKARYLHGEYEVTREDVVNALESKVPQDRAKRRVVAIGAEGDLAGLRGDWKASQALLGAKDAFVFQTYAPDHWHVAKYGFKTDGRPTIYVLEPDGKVLHRQDSYAGPDDLAQTLRRLRPDYDPLKDPSGGLLRPSAKIPWGTLAVIGAVLAGAYILTRKKK